MVRLILRFWTMKLGLLLQFYCCQGIAKFHLYWADSPETYNEAVLCAMSINKFREIMSNLHLDDNLRKNFNFNCRVDFSITALMKALSLAIENRAQNNF